MKVILLKDIENLGKTGEIKTVASGYGRNFLIPKGLASLLTSSEIKKIQEKLKQAKEIEEKRLSGVETLAKKISGLVLTFKVKTSKDEKIFGRVTASRISEKLKEGGFEISKKDIIMEPIKKLGEHKAIVNLSEGIKEELKIIIEEA